MPLSLLRELGARLVAIYGQHEHQTLLQESRHLALLDEFGGLQAMVGRVAQEFSKVRELESQRAKLAEQARQAGARQDYLEYLVNELDAAGLSAEEEQELLSRRKVLANAERLMQAANEAFEAFASEEGGAQSQVARAVAALRQAGKLDASLEQIVEVAEQALVHLDDAARSTESYVQGLSHEPDELSRIESRLDVMDKLKRKHRTDLPGLIELLESSRQELRGVESVDERLTAIERDMEAARQRLLSAAKKLSAARKKSAARLSKKVERELAELSMPETRFVVRVDARPAGQGGPGDLGDVSADETGIDMVRFHISPNPGEEPRPLAKIASGGELSRIMLGLKRILQQADPVPTLIFDEVDSGIGGQTASVVGAKLAKVAAEHQVLVITHLPQIARYGDCHFAVAKKVSKGRTSTVLSRLDPDDRVEEIARLIGGEPITDNSRTAARDLLERR